MSVKQNINGTLVNIAGSGSTIAERVTYDNTESGLTATDVQNAIDEVTSDLANKQDKLTNPLTQSDVVNNLTSTATNKPLSAAQGKALNDTISATKISTSHGTLTVSGSTRIYDVNSTSATTLAAQTYTWGSEIASSHRPSSDAAPLYGYVLDGNGVIKGYLCGVVQTNGTVTFYCSVAGTYYIRMSAVWAR